MTKKIRWHATVAYRNVMTRGNWKVGDKFDRNRTFKVNTTLGDHIGTGKLDGWVCGRMKADGYFENLERHAPRLLRNLEEGKVIYVNLWVVQDADQPSLPWWGAKMTVGVDPDNLPWDPKRNPTRIYLKR